MQRAKGGFASSGAANYVQEASNWSRFHNGREYHVLQCSGAVWEAQPWYYFREPPKPPTRRFHIPYKADNGRMGKCLALSTTTAVQVPSLTPGS